MKPAPAYDLAGYFDFARDLFCVAGLDGYFKLVNESFERVLGYSREDFLSRPFLEFVHPEDVQRSIDVLSVLATGEDVVGFESRFVCADGSVRRLEWNTRTMPQLGIVYGIARDVTERTALAEEQAALRHVATLVARESPPAEVFAAVAEELARLLGATSTVLYRYEDDGTATLAGDWGELAGPVPNGQRFPLGGNNVASVVFRTARPARIDDYADATGAIGSRFKALGVRAGVGVPIIVGGRLWGAMGAKFLQQTLDRDGADAASLVDQALEHAQRATDELRELAHGILPAALTGGGLRGASKHSRRARRSRCGSTSALTGCLPRSRRPPTSSSPRL